MEYTGFEAKVRAVLVKDEHLVMGILGLYGVLIIAGKAMSGGGDAKVEKKVSDCLLKCVGRGAKR